MPAYGSGKRGERILHEVAGRPRLGSFQDAAEGVKAMVDSVDTLHGGREHQMLDTGIQEAVLAAVRAGEYTVVWAGTPCSSFSVWWLAATMPTLRDREHPQGVPGLSTQHQEYVDMHNRLAEFTSRVIRAAWDAGCTVVVENPPDRGMRASPHFRWSTRHHAPLWLLPCMRELAAHIQPTWVTFPQCALAEDWYQKWTTLMTAGPRAHELRQLGQLSCTHTKHARVARGRNAAGVSHAAASGAYPLGMVAFVVWALLRPESWRGRGVEVPVTEVVALTREGLSRSLDTQRVANEAATTAVIGGQEADTLRPAVAGWRSVPSAMPAHWHERTDVTGAQWQQRRAEALRFISRRRAEPELAEKLARRPMPRPHVAPATGVVHGPALRGWPPGAPPRPVQISQLYHHGVYSDMQDHVAMVAGGLQGAESALQNGDTPAVARVGTRSTWCAEASQPLWARQRLWDCTDPYDCVPLEPYDDDDRVQHGISREFFEQWGERLSWPDRDMLRQVASSGVEGRSTCEWDTVVAGHHTGLREHYAPAKASIDGDTQREWITKGRPHFWTVPARCVPKNVVVQPKWKLDAECRIYKVLKHRVTTDDSISAEDTNSRNDSMDREHWAEATLPRVQHLAEAVAVVRAVARDMGILAARTVLERIALWALDLSDAYRELEVQRTER